MKVGILGGGLAGIVLAHFLQFKPNIERIDIIERAQTVGGLCRSFPIGSTICDIGPHILFSRNQGSLKFMLSVLQGNAIKLRRENKIYYKGIFVKYPFENDLYSLPEEDRKYCLNTFLNNPYAKLIPVSLLQFFLTTFGEGITNIYLKPYNEKMWKYNPALMDIQMISRIPRPPAADIIKSANGESTEGNLHQLYFYYPKQGGISALIQAFISKFSDKIRILTGYPVMNMEFNKGKWDIGNGESYDLLISTIPLIELTRAMGDNVPKGIIHSVENLKYNSIITVVLSLEQENLGNYLAVMVPDKNICFHRLTRVHYLTQVSTPTLLAEITFRPGDPIVELSSEELRDRVLRDLIKLGFINPDYNCMDYFVNKSQYAYVIYDLEHKLNVLRVKNFYEHNFKLLLCGRFGQHAYLNMDTVLENCQRLVNML